ncbi:MAG: hypothetical protein CPSOU_1803 [uncultured Paraburkholderia sp.]|nr:MAG: hypothetical protein CPSOU_1803 [uncultured Paraburkholderia sp.]
MKEITLSRGMVALVDDEDFEWLSASKWTGRKDGYACRNVPHPINAGKRTTLLMQRAIMGMESSDKREVDHIDGNRLNNCRSNLRICSHSENGRNKRPYRTSKSPFKGISKESGKSKWTAQIMVDGRQKRIGYFETPEEAHAAYRRAAAELHGEFARFE